MNALPTSLPAHIVLLRTITFCGLVFAFFLSAPVLAVSHTGCGEQIIAYQKKDAGESKAAAYATSNHGGKVLSVDKRNQEGRVVYRVKLLQDSGHIKIVTVDTENDNF